MSLLAYVHNWSPIALELGPLQVRWYGLAYLAGFIAAIYLLKWFSRRDLLRLQPQQCTDFIVLGALLGVMIGGRLGYVLLYDRSLLGFTDEPPWWQTLAIWKGGMASHGGILGVTLFVFWYGWKHRVPAVHLGDNLVVAAPLGLAFGRFANFINGELYGRPAEGVPWAVQFPSALPESTAQGAHQPDPQAAAEARRQLHEVVVEASRLVELPRPVQPAFNHQNYEAIVVAARSHGEFGPELTNILGRHLLERHPSQLYEMVVEGLLLFAVLLSVRLIGGKRLPYGVLTGLFFLLYALGRIAVERYRVPDASLIFGMTRGQFYSLFMILAALGFFAWAWWRGRQQAREAA